MIGIHIVAILFYLFFKRENLITPMLTGERTGDGLIGSKLGVAPAIPRCARQASTAYRRRPQLGPTAVDRPGGIRRKRGLGVRRSLLQR
jgi:hypothetical protein